MPRSPRRSRSAATTSATTTSSPTTSSSSAYWKKLDAESDRMQLQSRSARPPKAAPQLMAIITSPANHAKLERYKEISRRLSLAEGLTDDQARALAKEGKAVVWIDGGLHATEVLGAQQLMRDGLPDGQPDRRGDDADPERRDHPRRARQSGRHGPGGRLVHAKHDPGAIAAAIPGSTRVRRPRQQPRLLHERAAGDREHEPRACIASGSRRSSTTITRPARPAR